MSVQPDPLIDRNNRDIRPHADANLYAAKHLERKRPTAPRILAIDEPVHVLSIEHALPSNRR